MAFGPLPVYRCQKTTEMVSCFGISMGTSATKKLPKAFPWLGCFLVEQLKLGYTIIGIRETSFMNELSLS